jgi:hypothetical protein
LGAPQAKKKPRKKKRALGGKVEAPRQTKKKEKKRKKLPCKAPATAKEEARHPERS